MCRLSIWTSYDGLLLRSSQSEFARDIRSVDYLCLSIVDRDRIKIIWWDRDGLDDLHERLESGAPELSSMVNSKNSSSITRSSRCCSRGSMYRTSSAQTIRRMHPNVFETVPRADVCPKPFYFTDPVFHYFHEPFRLVLCTIQHARRNLVNNTDSQSLHLRSNCCEVARSSRPSSSVRDRVPQAPRR